MPKDVFTCPECGSTDVVEGYTGQPTCTCCGHEWEPDTEAEREAWALHCDPDDDALVPA